MSGLTMRHWLNNTLLALAVTLAGCSGQSWQTLDITGVMPELAFELTYENGETVTADQFEGRITLLYFGFTHCPDICPLTLSRLASVMRQLTPEERSELQVLFVSVDPARDSPEHLAHYTSAFGPEFEGLTGNQDALRALTRRYRVTYSYGSEDEHGFYDVSHSSAIFVFDRSRAARLVIRDSDPDSAVLNDLRQLI